MNIPRVFKEPDVAIAFILTNLVVSMPSSPATPPLTECNIRIDDPHFSESLQRGRGIVAVKVNARSKCNKPMSNLVLTVKIHKIGFIRDYEVAHGEVILNKTLHVFTEKTISVECGT